MRNSIAFPNVLVPKSSEIFQVIIVLRKIVLAQLGQEQVQQYLRHSELYTLKLYFE